MLPCQDKTGAIMNVAGFDTCLAWQCLKVGSYIEEGKGEETLQVEDWFMSRLASFAPQHLPLMRWVPGN